MSSKQNEKVSAVVEKFRNRKLAYKISVAVAMLLGICLVVMVAISAGLAGSSLGSSIKDEFSGVAAQNGQMVQSIITNASNTATVLQEYMQNKYAEYEKTGYNGQTEKSAVYDVKLQSMNKEIENFIINLASSTAKNNEEIAGVGAFFEENAFDAIICSSSFHHYPNPQAFFNSVKRCLRPGGEYGKIRSSNIETAKHLDFSKTVERQDNFQEHSPRVI